MDLCIVCNKCNFLFGAEKNMCAACSMCAQAECENECESDSGEEEIVEERSFQVTAEEIPSVTAEEIPGVTAEEIPGVTAEDIPSITAEEIPGVTAEDIPGITTQEILSITAEDIACIVCPEPEYTPSSPYPPDSPARFEDFQDEDHPPPKRARKAGTSIEPIDVEKTADAEVIVDEPSVHDPVNNEENVFDDSL
jgi:hypothetical protein